MTTAEIVNKARRIIGDTVEEYRWSDNEMREHVQEALQRLAVKAPQTRYMADGTIVDYVVVSFDPTDALPVADKYGEALALYVAYLCYLDDATDTVNASRAEACLARAEGLMV